MRNAECGMKNEECGMKNAECGMVVASRHSAFSIHNSAFIVVALIIGLTLAFTACTNSNFNKRSVIPEAEWPAENRVSFDVPIDDTINGYVFGMELRHLENYRYSNLFVFLHTTFPNGNVTRDTIECTLATPEGRWIGKSSGSMRDLRIPLNPNLQFPLTGTYHFEIEQAMREPVLKGISDIGIFVERQ